MTSEPQSLPPARWEPTDDGDLDFYGGAVLKLDLGGLLLAVGPGDDEADWWWQEDGCCQDWSGFERCHPSLEAAQEAAEAWARKMLTETMELLEQAVAARKAGGSPDASHAPPAAPGGPQGRPDGQEHRAA